MPPNTVKVTRPGTWGNPFKVGEWDEPSQRHMDGPQCVRLFRLMMMQTAWPELRKKVRDELGGKNLACFCALDKPCHADVLLVIANTTEKDLDNPDSKAWKDIFAIAE